jgi:hypothetical protein
MARNYNKTLISKAGRGTYLVWEKEGISINRDYIVGKFVNDVGLNTKPRLYRTHINARGDEYVTLPNIGRIYLHKPHLNSHKV